VAVLMVAGRPLTLEEMLALWPAGRVLPHIGTLWRWLRRARQLGLIDREGSGTKLDPHRHRLRVKEEDAEKEADDDEQEAEDDAA
jgi:hypothetical protein